MMAKKRIKQLMQVLFVAVLLTSCNQINDLRISSLESSIDHLESNYKELSPEKLQQEIEDCEKKMNDISKDSRRFTDSQKRRISSLKGRYHRVLFEIKVYVLANSMTEEGRRVLEYIKGLIGIELFRMDEKAYHEYNQQRVVE